MVRKSVAVDVQLIDTYDTLIRNVELEILHKARQHDAITLHLLRTIPGVGEILAMVILYEIHDISRFAEVGNFISYCRLVKCPQESAGKKMGSRNSKIGNVHLKWAFSEAACLFLRGNEEGQRYQQKLAARYGKAKALSIIAQQIARSAYAMLKGRQPFDPRNKGRDAGALASNWNAYGRSPRTRCPAQGSSTTAALTANSTVAQGSRSPSI